MPTMTAMMKTEAKAQHRGQAIPGAALPASTLPLPILDPHAWAQQTFGTAQLADVRRSKRVVQVAGLMASDPGASLPKQMAGHWGALKAAYRLLHEPDVSHEALSQPHWQQTRACANQQEQPVLLVHDETELDYGYDPAASGLGPIGNASHQGFFVHSVLALVPDTQAERVLGLAYQEPWVRKSAPRSKAGKKQSSKQRARRERESVHWQQAVKQIGSPAPGSRWIHVGDRYADMYDFWLAAQQSGCEVLVRVDQNRRLQEQAQEEGGQQLDHLIDRVKSWSPQASRKQAVASEHERRARQVRLCISWGQVHIQPTDLHGRVNKQAPVLTMWAVHVWEPEPPLRREGQRARVPNEKHGHARRQQQRRQQAQVPAEEERMEPLEWYLLTSVPVETEAEAWQKVDWYSCRWGVEDFHKGLKTGCRIQERHLRDEASLERLLAILSPISVRLLQLRELVEVIPEQAVLAWVPPEEAQLIAWQTQVPVEQLSMGRFLRAIAHLGGFLGRTSDGQPGWQTLWQGWIRLQWQAEAIRLANQHAPPQKCG
jgi:transposase-like protein/DDE family transposase